MNYSAENRVSTLESLAEPYGLVIDAEKIIAEETQAFRLNRTCTLPPTIGCEIEVKHSTVFPELFSKYFGDKEETQRVFYDLSEDEKEAFGAELKELSFPLMPGYEATRYYGIPKGKDCFWEFANKPTYSYRTLATEVDLLYKAGLIPANHEHSLHVTFGNMAPAGGGMALILSGLELCFVQPERIEQATKYHHTDKRSTWARRGLDGVRKRTGMELRLGATIATEFRTLTVSSSTQAKDIFRTGQALASVLVAFRQRGQADNAIIQDLGKQWPEYRSLIKGLWERRELPAESWGSPSENREKWMGWAACLEVRDDPGTLESKVVQAIAEVTDYIEPLLEALADELPMSSNIVNA